MICCLIIAGSGILDGAESQLACNVVSDKENQNMADKGIEIDRQCLYNIENNIRTGRNHGKKRI